MSREKNGSEQGIFGERDASPIDVKEAVEASSVIILWGYPASMERVGVIPARSAWPRSPP